MFNFLVNLWRTYQDRKQTYFGRRTSPSQNQLSDISWEQTQRINDLVMELPECSAYQQAIHSALQQALEQWLENPHTSSNNLVVLSNPIQPIASILENSQDILQTKKQIPINLLRWDSLPVEPIEILKKLKPQLERQQEKQEIILIPYLSSFFLRCVNGLEGIEYIRNIVLSDHTRFWVIGSHDWAWHYLDLGCQINSYFNHSILLPALEAKQLQEWLASIVSEAKINFSLQSNNGGKTSPNSQEMYFAKLAQLSDGCGNLALQLFMRSLKCQTDNSMADQERVIAVVDNLNLPKLPNLSFEEQYLLFSLLLHGNLTLPHLALTVEQIDCIVKSLVLSLQSSSLLKQEGELIRVNPLYYLQLKDLLTKNNFLIAQDSDHNYDRILFK